METTKTHAVWSSYDQIELRRSSDGYFIGRICFWPPIGKSYEDSMEKAHNALVASNGHIEIGQPSPKGMPVHANGIFIGNINDAFPKGRDMSQQDYDSLVQHQYEVRIAFLESGQVFKPCNDLNQIRQAAREFGVTT